MAFLSIFFKHKCVRLVRENFKIFSFGKYITGNGVYYSFLRYTLLQDRSRHIGELCKHVTVIWIFGFTSFTAAKYSTIVIFALPVNVETEIIGKKSACI